MQGSPQAVCPTACYPPLPSPFFPKANAKPTSQNEMQAMHASMKFFRRICRQGTHGGKQLLGVKCPLDFVYTSSSPLESKPGLPMCARATASAPQHVPRARSCFPELFGESRRAVVPLLHVPWLAPSTTAVHPLILCFVFLAVPVLCQGQWLAPGPKRARDPRAHASLTMTTFLARTTPAAYRAKPNCAGAGGTATMGAGVSSTSSQEQRLAPQRALLMTCLHDEHLVGRGQQERCVEALQPTSGVSHGRVRMARPLDASAVPMGLTILLLNSPSLSGWLAPRRAGPA